MLRKTTLIYLSVLLVLAVTTYLALMDGGYHTTGGAIAAIAIVSAVTSLAPFFVSRMLFRKYERDLQNKEPLKVWGWIVYGLCFPVKLLVIYSNVKLLISEGGHWAFG